MQFIQVVCKLLSLCKNLDIAIFEIFVEHQLFFFEHLQTSPGPIEPKSWPLLPPSYNGIRSTTLPRVSHHISHSFKSQWASNLNKFPHLVLVRFFPNFNRIGAWSDLYIEKWISLTRGNIWALLSCHEPIQPLRHQCFHRIPCIPCEHTTFVPKMQPSCSHYINHPSDVLL